MPAPEFLRQPAEILSYLSTLSTASESGEVLFQKNELHAKVYLHRGRIVWAFASGQEESFQSILIREKNLPKEKLLEGIKQARKEGKKSLDEILESLGVSNPEPRAHIINRHTRAALKEICSWQECVSQFNPHENLFKENVAGLSLEEILDKLGTPPEKEKLREMSLSGESVTSRPKPIVAQVVVEPGEQLQAEGSARERASYENKTERKQLSSIPQALEELRTEIPHFIAAMLLDCKTGMPIATLSDAPELDIEAISAFYRDVSICALSALYQMGKDKNGDCPLEEILITSKDDYVLLRTVHQGQHLLYLLIDGESNPGLARVVVKRLLPELNALF